MKVLVSTLLLLGCGMAAFAAEAQAQAQNRKSLYEAQARDGAHGHGGGHSSVQFGGGKGGSGISHGHSGGSVQFGGGKGAGGIAHGHVSHGKGGDSYSAPTENEYHAPAKEGPNAGVYYYYYPVQQQQNKKNRLFGTKGGEKGFMGKMMDFFFGHFTSAYDFFAGRALASRASDYLPMPIFEKIALMIQEEMYKEECLSRTICQLGKSAEGYETFLNLSEFFVPEEYQGHLRTFKDSALKKTECAVAYKCKSMSPSAQQL